jgi:Uma2 family endonuclease
MIRIPDFFAETPILMDMHVPMLTPSGMTPEQYIAWEQQQQDKHDYYKGEVFLMAGGTDAHNTVCTNAVTLHKTHLKQTACRVYMSDMRLELVKANHYCFSGYPHHRLWARKFTSPVSNFLST